jgi:hypothetical protein
MGRDHELLVEDQLPPSISISFSRMIATLTYQNSYCRVVVGIVYVVRELFDNLKEASYKSIINVYCAR